MHALFIINLTEPRLFLLSIQCSLSFLSNISPTPFPPIYKPLASVALQPILFPIQAEPCPGRRIRSGHNLRLINTVSRTKVKGVGRRGNSEYHSLHYTLYTHAQRVWINTRIAYTAAHVSCNCTEQSERLVVGMVSITPLSSIPPPLGEYFTAQQQATPYLTLPYRTKPCNSR